MRISTSQFYAASLTGILNQQNTLNTLSQQLATGSTLTNPSDQPVAAAQNVTLTGQINRLATYSQNGQNAQNALQLESATVQSVGTLV
ncbi:MAG: flagellar biosynthesis protein FlgL, partial [Thiomonas sp. 20-64-5]